MGKLKKAGITILYVIAMIVTIGSILSIFRNTENRYLKMLDFPRIQFFIVACLNLALFLLVLKWKKWYDYLLVLGLVGSIAIQSSYLINYTKLVSETVSSVIEERRSSQVPISILLVNVKMSNQNAQPLIELIETKQPDLVIAMETDSWWNEQLQSIETQYLHTHKAINNVAYGMALYSKYPLSDTKTNYFNNRKVPSFESIIQLNNQGNVVLYSLHPVPPTHFEELPDNSGQQEVAMMEVGKKIKDRKLPSIVVGDINDVSWGSMDALTGTKGLLHDVRVGRGFYNSYNANNILMRWPLDHVFVTKEFGLLKIERLSGIGSDHFPIYTELLLQ